jgi:hypothetical protein
LTKTLSHWSAFVDQAPFKSKACACEVSRRQPQNRRAHSPVDRLTLNIARLLKWNAKFPEYCFAWGILAQGAVYALPRQGRNGKADQGKATRLTPEALISVS